MLVRTFIALNFGEFDVGNEGAVRRLIDEAGDLAVDVWNKLRRHVAAMGKKQLDLETDLRRFKDATNKGQKNEIWGWNPNGL